MKTTIEIEDVLFRAAQEAAKEDRTTLRSLMEEGLRLALARREEGPRFKLRDVSVDGSGLTPEFAGASWEQIRAAIY